MFKFLFKFIIYSTIIVFMLSVSTEATKISRDKARLTNAHILSQSIQYYKMIHNNLPQSGPNENISDLLLNEQILFDPMRDPVYTSSTIKFDNNVELLYSSYQKLSDLMNKDTLAKNYEYLKVNILEYFNLSYNQTDTAKTDSAVFNTASDTLSSSWVDDFQNDCVIVYSSDNLTNSYEISICLESEFYKHMKKWDGGNDDNRYEIGSDLRLDTAIILNNKNQITSSLNSSIIQ